MVHESGVSNPELRAACPVCGGAEARHERRLDGYTLLRCSGCRMVFGWPRPTRGTSLESYSRGLYGAIPTHGAPPLVAPEKVMAQVDAERTSNVEHAQARRLRDLARRRPVGRMLDFGCGSGHLLDLARRVLGCETYGVDLDPVARLGAHRFGFTLHAGPVDTAPFESGSFDLVYAEQVFEHLTEPRAELPHLRDLLAPGGLLFIEAPSYESLSIRLRRDDFILNRPPGHLNYFGRAPLRLLLESCGLEVLDLRTSGLAYRDLFGWRRAASIAPGASGTGSPPTLPSAAAAPCERTRVGTSARLKFRLLHGLDSLLSVPGWGIQLQVVARRPSDRSGPPRRRRAMTPNLLSRTP